MIADIVLMFHFAIIFFITFGFFLIPIGYSLGWIWIKNSKLRKCHCGMMIFVTFETILGITCPLTLIENSLRGINESTSFISYWINQIIYWNFPNQLFIVLYCICLVWTFLIWKIFPPMIENNA